MKKKLYFIGLIAVGVSLSLLRICYGYWTDELAVKGNASLRYQLSIVDDTTENDDDKNKEDKKNNNEKEKNDRDNKDKDNKDKDNRDKNDIDKDSVKDADHKGETPEDLNNIDYIEDDQILFDVDVNQNINNVLKNEIGSNLNDETINVNSEIEDTDQEEINDWYEGIEDITEIED